MDQFLLISPNLKALSIEGIISPLTEVMFTALYACPLILATLRSFTLIYGALIDPNTCNEPLISTLFNEASLYRLALLVLVNIISPVISSILYVA